MKQILKEFHQLEEKYHESLSRDCIRWLMVATELRKISTELEDLKGMIKKED